MANSALLYALRGRAVVVSYSCSAIDFSLSPGDVPAAQSIPITANQ